MRQYYVFFVVCVLLKGKMENFAFRTFDLGAVVECKTNPKCLLKKNQKKNHAAGMHSSSSNLLTATLSQELTC